MYKIAKEKVEFQGFFITHFGQYQSRNERYPANTAVSPRYSPQGTSPGELRDVCDSAPKIPY